MQRAAAVTFRAAAHQTSTRMSTLSKMPVLHLRGRADVHHDRHGVNLQSPVGHCAAAHSAFLLFVAACTAKLRLSLQDNVAVAGTSPCSLQSQEAAQSGQRGRTADTLDLASTLLVRLRGAETRYTAQSLQQDVLPSVSWLVKVFDRVNRRGLHLYLWRGKVILEAVLPGTATTLTSYSPA